jgi:hypothetical protein
MPAGLRQSAWRYFFENVSMMLMIAGPSRTINSVGRMNRIIGTVSIAGSRAAFSSARVMRASRNSAARMRSDCASGVPNLAVCSSVFTTPRMEPRLVLVGLAEPGSTIRSLQIQRKNSGARRIKLKLAKLLNRFAVLHCKMKTVLQLIKTRGS